LPNLLTSSSSFCPSPTLLHFGFCHPVRAHMLNESQWGGRQEAGRHMCRYWIVEEEQSGP
jgi:hypothetical protein